MEAKKKKEKNVEESVFVWSLYILNNQFYLHSEKARPQKLTREHLSAKPQPRQSKGTILMIPDKIVRQNILQGAMKLYITADGSIERIKWEASAVTVEDARMRSPQFYV